MILSEGQDSRCSGWGIGVLAEKYVGLFMVKRQRREK